MAASACAIHHAHEASVGVCASCLRERLATSIGKSRGGGGGEAEAATSNEAFRCSVILSEGIGNNGSPANLRERNKRTLSYYLDNIHGVSWHCQAAHASHRKAISSDAIYCQGNSSYSALHYVPHQGAQAYPSLPKEPPAFSNVFSKGRPLSWLSAFFSKREAKQKACSGESSIAPWRNCSQCEEPHDRHSLSSEAPSWEQLSPWPRIPTRSPLNLSQFTRSPLKLSPLLNSAHSTRSPLHMVTSPLSSQSTRSPLKLPPLRSSSQTPLKLSPLLSYPRSPLKLLSSKPTKAWDGKAHDEMDQTSGHGISSVQVANRREIWSRILMRNKWVVRFKRHFAQKKKQEDVEADRTPSARKSDFCRYGQNHDLVRGRHGQNHWLLEKNQRSPMLSRPSRGDRESEQHWGSSASGRDYAGWESYFNNSLNGLKVRHRYHSADSAELLRFYLTPPVRSTAKLRSYHYY